MGTVSTDKKDIKPLEPLANGARNLAGLLGRVATALEEVKLPLPAGEDLALAQAKLDPAQKLAIKGYQAELDRAKGFLEEAKKTPSFDRNVLAKHQADYDRFRDGLTEFLKNSNGATPQDAKKFDSWVTSVTAYWQKQNEKLSAQIGEAASLVSRTFSIPGSYPTEADVKNLKVNYELKRAGSQYSELGTLQSAYGNSVKHADGMELRRDPKDPSKIQVIAPPGVQVQVWLGGNRANEPKTFITAQNPDYIREAKPIAVRVDEVKQVVGAPKSSTQELSESVQSYVKALESAERSLAAVRKANPPVAPGIISEFAENLEKYKTGLTKTLAELDGGTKFPRLDEWAKTSAQRWLKDAKLLEQEVEISKRSVILEPGVKSIHYRMQGTEYAVSGDVEIPETGKRQAETHMDIAGGNPQTLAVRQLSDGRIQVIFPKNTYTTALTVQSQSGSTSIEDPRLKADA